MSLALPPLGLERGTLQRALGLGLVLLVHLGAAYWLLNARSELPPRDLSNIVRVNIVQDTERPVPTDAGRSTTPAPTTALQSVAPKLDPVTSTNAAALAPPVAIVSREAVTAPLTPEPATPKAPADTRPAMAISSGTQGASPAEAAPPVLASRTDVPAPGSGVPAPPRTPAPSPSLGAAGNPAPTLSDLCPSRVKAQAPARASKAGIGGMVLARASIRSGRVVRVEILKSEPAGLFDAAVRSAMLQYGCRDQGPGEILAEQLFEFKLAE